MKQLLTILLVFLSLTALCQSIYNPTNPDSIKIAVQVNGAIRYVYMADLMKNKANIATLNNYLLKRDTTDKWQPKGISFSSGGGNYYLPFNGLPTYYLGGDSALHLLPSDAATLGGHSGSHYLDYNNLTNTPNLSIYASIASLNNYLLKSDSGNMLAPYLRANVAAATYQPKGNYLISESDPLFAASAASGITGTNITNWNTAFGWGNHASAGYELSSHSAATYVVKAPGKGLSTEDYTTAEKTKLAGIAAGATNVTNNNQIANGANYLTGINSSQVTTALGFTPYNSTNPSGYITSSALSTYELISHAASTYQPIGSYLTTTIGDARYYPLSGNPSGYLISSDITGKQNTLVSGTNIKTINGNSLLGGGDLIITGGGGSTPITDNLTTSTTGTALDAHQGFVIKGLIDGNTTSISGKEPAIAAGISTQYWRGDKTWQALNSTAVGLGSVENTALSTWAGSSTITTVGTIATGTWNGTAIGVTKGGTGLTSVVLGNIPYGSATNTLATLAGNTTTIKKFLTQTGDGTNSAAPVWIDLFGGSNSWTNTKNVFSGTFTGTSQYGVLNVGSGPFDGTTTGFFNGSSAGTIIAGNAPSGFTGRLVDLQLNGSTQFFVTNAGNVFTNGRIGIKQSNMQGLLQMSNGNSISTAFTTTGMGLVLDAQTFTSTASSGTVAATGAHTIGQPTFTANAATTLTNASTLRIANSPAAGTNITITNPYALEVAAGNVLFNNNLTVNGSITANNLSGANTGDETGASIKTKLTALTGTNRLDASAIQNIPAAIDTTSLSKRIDSLKAVQLYRITIAGQSQAEGAAHVSSLASYPLNIDTFHFTDTLKRVLIWNTTRSQYEPLVIGANNRAANDLSVTVYPPATLPTGGYTAFGPELGIAQRWIEENPTGTLLIDKWVADGQKIGQFGKDTGGVWTQMVSGRALATAWLKARGLTAYDKGWLFLQGNADNGSTQAYYQAQLTKLIRDLTANKYLNTSATLVIPQDPALAAHPEAVDVNINNARLAVAAANPNVVVFTYDITTIPEDGKHADAYSQLNIGYNTYKYIFNTSYKKAWADTVGGITGGGGTSELLTSNSDYSNAAWTKTNATVTVDATTDPDGTTLADKIIANTTSGQHYVMQQITKATTAKTYTYSIYAKRSGTNMNASLVGQDATGANAAYALFDLGTGTVITSGAVGFTVGTTSMTAAANGFYKCSMTFTTGTQNNVQAVTNVISSSTDTFAGNNTDGIFLYKASLQ